MSKGIQKLSALKVSKPLAAGLYGDGAGLWLQVTKTGTRSWLFRYMRHGKAREMGLGALHTVSLLEAREKARLCRVMLSEGKDPLEEKQIALQKSMLEAAKAITFQTCATLYVDAHRAGWKNEKHAWQWMRTLEMFVFPVIGNLAVSDIDTGLVLKCLEPIWTSKAETASRVRQRIEVVLDWAKVRGYRTGENPAFWRGHLDKLLPARSKVSKVKHHAALNYNEMPVFFDVVSKQDGIAAKALIFAIFTATRTSEALKATWSEIDMKAKVWVIPAERMKNGIEHKVPLSSYAMRVLEEMAAIKQSEYVFAGAKYGKPLSNTAMLMTLRRMNYGHITTHGFRSSFKVWASETTAYSNEASEKALSHKISDKVEAAYSRGDFFEKRKRLMEDWAVFCTSPVMAKNDNVVGIRA